MLLAILLLTVGTTWLNADDKLVGRTAPVPLDMLMDQRTYGLALKLKDGSGDTGDTHGGRGLHSSIDADIQKVLKGFLSKRIISYLS
mgnify:CR=1 FL=1